MSLKEISWTTISEQFVFRLKELTETHYVLVERVIETLEVLKMEAAEVTKKVEETDIVMAEVEEVTNEYLPLAQACSAIFFVLEELHLLHHFYQFSLRFFLDIFDFVLLHNPSLKGVTDPQARLSILIRDLFLHVFKRTSRALLHTDHLTLAILLAQVKLGGSSTSLSDREFAFLLEGGEAVTVNTPPIESNLLDGVQRQRLQAFSRLSCFEDVIQQVKSEGSDWQQFLSSPAPELCIPAVWDNISRK